MLGRTPYMTSKLPHSFRIFFVVFSLFLMGDAFYRWDGFAYYASFSEFIPAVALVTIFWTMTAAAANLVMWLPFRGVAALSAMMGRHIGREHFQLFASLFMLFWALLWGGKYFLWPYDDSALQLGVPDIIAVFFMSLSVSWLLRSRAGRWMPVFHQRITPLVWLFGVWLIISVPVVGYHTLLKTDGADMRRSVQVPSAEGRTKPNIILVTFDALTARDMSAYGYHRDTTPFISEWARRGTLFTRAEAESNFTTPTTASLMVGKRVWSHQAYHIRGAGPEKSLTESLPLELKKHGYVNMAFVVNSSASVETLGVSGAFDTAPFSKEFTRPRSFFERNMKVFDTFLHRLFSGRIMHYNWIIREDFILSRQLDVIFSEDHMRLNSPPEKAFDRFLSVIDKERPRPFFAWIHLFPPHDPYLPPEPYFGMFDPSGKLSTHREQIEASTRILASGTDKPFFSPEIRPEVDALRARYNEFIRYCDSQYEGFIAELERRGLPNDTAVILSSDHGESFAHNFLRHTGPHLYEQVTHIPLIIAEPGQTEGRVVHDLVEQVDIAPTILDIAGVPVPSWMEGRSLVPLMKGGSLPERPAFSMYFGMNPRKGRRLSRGTVAVWDGGYKLIHYIEEDRSLLFDLQRDPEETNDLFSEENETALRLLGLVKENLDKAGERIAGDSLH